MARSSLLLLSFLLGCTATPNVGETRAPIIGGTVDSGDPAVVLLYAQVAGQEGGSLCTAEVISPHVVLTAAHCVEEVGATYAVFLGTDFATARAADLLPVSEVHADPLFNGNNLEAGHDIGVAILSKPAPVTPIAINRTPLTTALVGKPVRFVGYGLDNAQAQTGAGVKRQTATTLTDYNNLLLHFSDGVHETCNGDSGGPAFMTVDGKEVIVGLTSFGDINCNQGGYDTRVDSMLPFVDKYLAQFDPTPSAPPDMAQPPAPQPGLGADLAQPAAPPQSPSEPQPATPDPQPATPPASTPAASGRGAGEACARDADCTSQLCGLGAQGTLVCVSGNALNGDLYGGCSVGGRDDRMTLAFLVTLALLLSRSFKRRRR